MEKLRKFETEEQYTSFKDSDNVIYPHVCYAKDTDKVFLKKEGIKEITFYIYGDEHKAIKGMTWGEWCRYGIGVEVDGQYDPYYSIYPGYNDGSDNINGFYPGCDCTWSCIDNGKISTDTYDGRWCQSCGVVYIIDAKCDDIIEEGRDYDVDTSGLQPGGGSWG